MKAYLGEASRNLHATCQQDNRTALLVQQTDVLLIIAGKHSGHKTYARM
jgi:hypothetical protein